MSLVVGKNRGLRSIVQLLVLGAIVAVALNSKDIKRYLKIRGM